MESLGFAGFRDMIGTVFGLKDYPFLKMQILGTLLVWLCSLEPLVRKYVWDPPEVAGFIIVLTLINAWYGYRVSVKIHKTGFNWPKLHKTFGVIITDLLLMGIITFVSTYKSYYAPLTDLLFGYFFTWKLRQIWVHMKLLDLQKGEFSGIFGNYLEGFLKSKYGADTVNNLQPPREDQEKENLK